MKTYRFIHHHQLHSTNAFALEMLQNNKEEGLVITADMQTHGAGQRGKVWDSASGENLLMSVVLQPNCTTRQQQSLNSAVALALYDVLVEYFATAVSIKWPNDMMIDNKKIAGILIQNKVVGAEITHAVVGIGLNVNQTQFKDYFPEATSFALEKNTLFNLIKIRDALLSRLANRVDEMKMGKNVQVEYTEALFLRDELADFQHAENTFKGIIRGVTDEGALRLEQQDGSIHTYQNQEIRYLF